MHLAKIDRSVVRRPRAAVEEQTSQTADQLSTDSVATAKQQPSSDSLEAMPISAHHAARLAPSSGYSHNECYIFLIIKWLWCCFTFHCDNHYKRQCLLTEEWSTRTDEMSSSECFVCSLPMPPAAVGSCSCMEHGEVQRVWGHFLPYRKLSTTQQRRQKI